MEIEFWQFIVVMVVFSALPIFMYCVGKDEGRREMQEFYRRREEIRKETYARVYRIR